jgi:hypothetical protein
MSENAFWAIVICAVLASCQAEEAIRLTVKSTGHLRLKL